MPLPNPLNALFTAPEVDFLPYADLQLGDRTLIETDVRMVEVLHKAFEKFIFSEQVTLANRVGQLHRLALHGQDAHAVLSDAAGTTLPELAPLGSASIGIFDTDMI